MNSNSKLGISCKKKEWIPDVIDFIQQYDLHHLELQIEDIEDDADIFKMSFLDDLKGLQQQFDFSMSLHSFNGINLGEKITRIRKTCVDIITEIYTAAEYLKCTHITLHLGNAGFQYDNPKKQQRLDLIIQSLNDILSRTKGSHVALGIENTDRLVDERKCYLGDDHNDFKYIFGLLHHDRLGIVLDVGHCNLQPSGVNALLFAEEFSKEIVAVHLHTNNMKKDEHKGIEDNWFQENDSLWKAISNKIIILENHCLDDARQSVESIESFCGIKQNSRRLK